MTLEELQARVKYNPNIDRTKIIPTDKKLPEVDPLVDGTDPIDKSEKPFGGLVINNSEPTPVYDNIVSIDIDDYRAELGNDIFLPDFGGVDALDSQRANAQGWLTQAGNFLGQAVVGEIIGGTIEGLGYILDAGNILKYAKGEEMDWGNAITDLGKGMREWGQENMAIHQRAPGTFDMGDTGWWFGNGVSVFSSLSMIMPSMAATKALGFIGKGISRGLGAMHKGADIAAKMGRQSKWISKGVSQAITSRHIENSMEASGTFEQIKREHIEAGKTEEEAIKSASEAAAFNYNAGWVMLLQDIPQYLLIGKVFNPITGKVSSKLKQIKGKGLKPTFLGKTAKGVAMAGSEGLEEGYQFIIAEEGKYYSNLKAGLTSKEEYSDRMLEYAKDGELWTSVLFGSLGGALFQQVGPAAGQIFKSKDVRENEKNFGKFQREAVKNRGMEIAAAHSKFIKAQESGNATHIEMARDNMILSSTLNALDSDNFDLHIETLEALLDITEDEKAALEKNDIQVESELFKQYIPKAVEQSHLIKEDYLKYRNKHSKGVARGLAHNNHLIETFTRLRQEGNKAKQKVMSNIVGISQLTGIAKDRLINNIRIHGLKEANKYIKNNSNKYSEIQIEENLNEIKQLTAKNARSGKEDNRTENEKKLDNKYKKGLERNKDLQFIEGDDILYDLKILEYQDDMIEMQSEEYAKKVKKDEAIEEMSALQTEEQVDVAINNLNKNDDFSEEEKIEIRKELSQKKENIKAQLKQQEIDAKAAVIKAEVLAKQKKEEEDTNTVPEVVLEESVFDDPLSYTETPTESQVMDNDDFAMDAKVEGSNDMRILDEAGSSIYKGWLVNGKDKVNTPVEYGIGDPITTKAKEAINAFNNGEINDNVYRFLPIRVTFDGDKTKFAFLISSEMKSADPKARTSFENIDLPERINIIDAMLAEGGTTQSVITRQYGGELQFESEIETDNGTVYPTNVITDLQYLKNKTVADIELIITDEDGYFMDENKESHSIKSQMMVKDLGKNGESIPYAGGVFFVVPKADGHPFPIRAEIAYHTAEEAKTIAEILINVTSIRTLKYNTLINDMKDSHPELYARIKEHHSAELELLGAQGTVAEFVDTFVYISDTLAGKKTELELSGWIIKFGDKFGLNPDNIEEARPRLEEFLRDIKKRQLNIKKWAETNPNHIKYREYMINNKILSTRASKGTLFAKGENRHVSMYAASKAKPIQGRTLEDRLSETNDIDVKKNNETSLFEATYIDKNNEKFVLTHAIKSKVIGLVDAAYASETSDITFVPPKKSDIKISTAPKKVVPSPLVKTEDSKKATNNAKWNYTETDELADMSEVKEETKKETNIKTINEKNKALEKYSYDKDALNELDEC